MINIELCKKTLNQKGKGFTDEQVKKIREFLYQMAQLEFQNFKKKKEDEKGRYLFKSIN